MVPFVINKICYATWPFTEIRASILFIQVSCISDHQSSRRGSGVWCYFIDVLSGFVSNFKFKSDSRSPEIFVILLGFFNN